LIAGKNELLENYYAWEWGDALFVVLDPFNNTLTNPNSAPADNWRWSLGKQQYDWLKATLQNSRASYKFLFMHHLVGGIESARGGVETAHRYEWGGKNADDTEGFAAKRPGWDMPIHQLLIANKVSAVFHGHDHFYGYQQLDGVVYQECPQPGTANFSTASATDGKYAQGTILPNSGHLRVTVSADAAKVEYVRAALPTQETAVLKNRTVSHTYTMAPAK
jgi:phosphodiesterase/alkaline phosphatase D-like protein